MWLGGMVDKEMLCAINLGEDSLLARVHFQNCRIFFISACLMHSATLQGLATGSMPDTQRVLVSMLVQGMTAG